VNVYREKDGETYKNEHPGQWIRCCLLLWVLSTTQVWDSDWIWVTITWIQSLKLHQIHLGALFHIGSHSLGYREPQTGVHSLGDSASNWGTM